MNTIANKNNGAKGNERMGTILTDTGLTNTGAGPKRYGLFFPGANALRFDAKFALASALAIIGMTGSPAMAQQKTASFAKSVATPALHTQTNLRTAPAMGRQSSVLDVF